jgi:hypothetical protein
MAYNFLRGDRDQPFLLPPDLRDWLPAGLWVPESWSWGAELRRTPSLAWPFTARRIHPPLVPKCFLTVGA